MMVSMAIGIISFLISIAYWPLIDASSRWSFVNNAGNSPRWALLAVAIPLLLIFIKSDKNYNWTVLIASLSLLWTSNLFDGLEALIHLVILIQVFALGSRLETLKPVFEGLSWGIVVTDFTIIFDFYPSGLFVNPNVLGDTALLILVGAVYYRLWVYIPALLFAVIVANSRGVWLSGAVIALVWAWNRYRNYYWGYVLLIAVCANLCMIALLAFFVSYRTGTIVERLDLWHDTLSGLTLFGHGLGSYFTSYSFYSSFDTLKIKPIYAHNDYLQIIFETGVVGLVLWCYFIFSIRNYIFWTFLLLCCFSFPFYLPTTAFIAAIVAGHFIGNGVGLWDLFARWRILLFNWCAGPRYWFTN